MSFLLSWFKSEKKKEMESLLVEEKKIEVELLRKQLEETNIEPEEEEPAVSTKPYIGLRLVNDILTVILADGSLITRPASTQLLFNLVRSSTTEAELLSHLNDVNVVKEIKEEKIKKEESERIGKLINDAILQSGDFIEEGGSVYMKDIKRSIPPLLLEEFAELIYDGTEEAKSQYEALKKFWVKCCLNPNARSAEDLYEFLTYHNFKIDKHGNFYAYRKVVSKSSAADKFLIDFISNVYIKVKAVWKKKSEDFRVEKVGEEYKFRKVTSTPEGIIIGNLDTLYKDLPNMAKNTYTSAHTGKEDYRVGDVISMPRYLGNDDNTVSCSRGFHAASKKYNYSGFGDTPILMIINPVDVLAVPVGEVGKLRVCRWFFASTLVEEEKYILDDDDFDVTELGDIFEEKCMADLTEHVHNSFAEEVKRHTYTIPSISSTDIGDMVATLERMSSVVAKRVVKIS
jgi:hypothetical protein